MNRDEALEEAARLRSEGIAAFAGPVLDLEGEVLWKVFRQDLDSTEKEGDSG